MQKPLRTTRCRQARPAVDKPRQRGESVDDTFKGQLDLGRSSGHTPAGVVARVQQRKHSRAGRL
jgi:hypothetical protein